MERFDDRLAGARLRERRVEVRLEVVERVDPEDPALAARIGRLQHRRQADLERAVPLAEVTHRGERGLATPCSAKTRRIATLCVIACAVSTPMPGNPSASATAATTGTARSADTVSTPSTECSRPTSLDRRDVGEVDHLARRSLRRGRGRPRSGRRRRRVVRARAHARSPGAGAAPRRRKGPFPPPRAILLRG